MSQQGIEDKYRGKGVQGQVADLGGIRPEELVKKYCYHYDNKYGKHRVLKYDKKFHGFVPALPVFYIFSCTIELSMGTIQGRIYQGIETSVN